MYSLLKVVLLLLVAASMACQPQRDLEALYHTFWLSTNIAKHAQKLETIYRDDSTLYLHGDEVTLTGKKQIVWGLYRKIWDAFSKYTIVEKAMLYDGNTIFTLMHIEADFTDKLHLQSSVYPPTGAHIIIVAGHLIELKNRKVFSERYYLNLHDGIKQLQMIAGVSQIKKYKEIKNLSRIVEQTQTPNISKIAVNALKQFFTNKGRGRGSLVEIINFTASDKDALASKRESLAMKKLLSVDVILSSNQQAVLRFTAKSLDGTSGDIKEFLAYYRNSPKPSLILLGDDEPLTNSSLEVEHASK